MKINTVLNELLSYGINNSLISESDIIYSANKLIDILKLNDFSLENITYKREINQILEDISDYSIENSLIENTQVHRDLFDTKIMDCIMPRPSEVLTVFNKKYADSKLSATDYYYNLSIASNYIRMDRIKKNICWQIDTEYGKLDLAINLSKPEKDPKAIAMAASIPQASYPKCLLCYENVGFAGNLNHPARQNHRILPIKLNNENWFMQYSPYVYYNEHCIVFNKEHVPMKVSKEAFIRLFDFLDIFPHYFIGANAGLPIVGGSILSHDHFQGGKYDFSMASAQSLYNFTIDGYENLKASYLNWPLDVIRLQSESKDRIISLSDKILKSWSRYDDEKIGVISHTNNILHNAITPIARKRDDLYEIDLVLRNNRTDSVHPYGIFHPDERLHHIKKENIGLIEVLGLAILPARLKNELTLIKQYLLCKNMSEKQHILENDELKKHKDWCLELNNKYSISKPDDEAIDSILYYETGNRFKEVLKACSVFKMGNRLEAVKRFVNNINELSD